MALSANISLAASNASEIERSPSSQESRKTEKTTSRALLAPGNRIIIRAVSTSLAIEIYSMGNKDISSFKAIALMETS